MKTDLAKIWIDDFFIIYDGYYLLINVKKINDVQYDFIKLNRGELYNRRKNYKLFGPLTTSNLHSCCAIATQHTNKKLPEELHNMALIEFMEYPKDIYIKKYFEIYG